MCAHILLPAPSFCENCGVREERCALCKEFVHDCAKEIPVPKGYRVIPEFPEYMVNKKANVRHIATGKSCWLDRVNRYNEAIITLQKDGKKFRRSAQALRESVFGIRFRQNISISTPEQKTWLSTLVEPQLTTNESSK